uniref:Exocyst subunit Exo70 family protein n=1 Tax=Noccaea caerulescens TaxID=107243 RepID=A0A1J3FI67_NOCCA
MEPPENSGGLNSEGSTLETAERIILRWDSAASGETRGKMIFQSDRDEVDRFLRAVDEIQRTLSSLSFSSPSSSSAASAAVDDHEVKANSAIQIAMARLEEEFRSILLSHTSVFEPDSLFLEESVSSHSSRTEIGEDSSVTAGDDDPAEEEEEDDEESNPPDGSGSSRLTRRRSSYRSTSSIREMDLISPEAVSDLRSIVQRMVAAGYSRECIQVYGNVRKSAMETIFKQLGIVKMSIGDVQRLEWEVVEGKIRRWIRAAKVCIRIVFSSEKRLCEQLFDGISTAMDETCFMETVKSSALRLFTFPEAISISRRSPEKLFKILDLHDALTDMLPDIEAIFDSDSSNSIRVQAAEIQSRLAEAARGILTEFENAVLREPSVVPITGGTIHPLTRYVMNYISLISDYKQTLFDLIVSNPTTGSDPNTTPVMDFTELESKSPFDLHLIWLIVVLHFNLEEKSHHYRDASLSHIFIMNNIHYIVQKVKGSPELREMIGDHYLRKLTGILRHAATNYQRATWVRVLNSLRDEGLHVSGSFSSGVSRSALRDRFKAFNGMFEEVHRTQSTWSVPDPQLREELRISLSEHLIPAYRSFLGRFRGHIESGRHPEYYLKYTVEDIETIVLDLFEGYATPPHLRRR